MARRLTPAERLAEADKDATLEQIVKRSTWDQFLVEQAVFAFGLANDEWSCNQLREVLPEMGRGFLGAAINALRSSGVIEHTGRMVPSTQANTHGHRIAVWRLSVKGLLIAQTRRPAASKEAAA